MKCDKDTLLLYAVTDRAWTGSQPLARQVEAALQNGATCLQLREKALDPAAFREEARQMAALCRRYGVPLIINDNVEVALACGAAGVHLGQQDMPIAQARRMAGPDLILGASAHTVQEALEAQAAGADYLGVGAVFSTSTKADASPLPLTTLREICAAVSIPVVAIGGITETNLLQLTGCGAAGVAVVSAIFGAPDPGAATARLVQLARQMTGR
ncbi:thiamine phosphate synthase [Faecalibacterium sp. An121]|uniref:thiamine phosphate synthase n=1 Tax=Faecalibacterium sp. An121 TaxID=1965550 RepID=UPI000B3ADDB5|nr:thiamine phosphate synthase [Faecalibacterium sp. An121]OUQ40144.1 thiamine-phosphate diphosphorylase [Faecalibacterium sp. An121]